MRFVKVGCGCGESGRCCAVSRWVLEKKNKKKRSRMVLNRTLLWGDFGLVRGSILQGVAAADCFPKGWHLWIFLVVPYVRHVQYRLLLVVMVRLRAVGRHVQLLYERSMLSSALALRI